MRNDAYVVNGNGDRIDDVSNYSDVAHLPYAAYARAAVSVLARCVPALANNPTLRQDIFNFLCAVGERAGDWSLENYLVYFDQCICYVADSINYALKLHKATTRLNNCTANFLAHLFFVDARTDVDDAIANLASLSDVFNKRAKATFCNPDLAVQDGRKEPCWFCQQNAGKEPLVTDCWSPFFQRDLEKQTSFLDIIRRLNGQKLPLLTIRSLQVDNEPLLTGKRSTSAAALIAYCMNDQAQEKLAEVLLKKSESLDEGFSTTEENAWRAHHKVNVIYVDIPASSSGNICITAGSKGECYITSPAVLTDGKSKRLIDGKREYDKPIVLIIDVMCPPEPLSFAELVRHINKKNTLRLHCPSIKEPYFELLFERVFCASSKVLLQFGDADLTSLSRTLHLVTHQPPPGIETVVVVDLCLVMQNYPSIYNETGLLLPESIIICFLLSYGMDLQQAIVSARVLESSHHCNNVLYVLQNVDYLCFTQPFLLIEILKKLPKVVASTRQLTLPEAMPEFKLFSIAEAANSSASFVPQNRPCRIDQSVGTHDVVVTGFSYNIRRTGFSYNIRRAAQPTEHPVAAGLPLDLSQYVIDRKGNRIDDIPIFQQNGGACTLYAVARAMVSTWARAVPSLACKPALREKLFRFLIDVGWEKNPTAQLVLHFFNRFCELGSDEWSCKGAYDDRIRHELASIIDELEGYPLPCLYATSLHGEKEIPKNKSASMSAIIIYTLCSQSSKALSQFIKEFPDTPVTRKDVTSQCKPDKCFHNKYAHAVYCDLPHSQNVGPYAIVDSDYNNNKPPEYFVENVSALWGCHEFPILRSSDGETSVGDTPTWPQVWLFDLEKPFIPLSFSDIKVRICTANNELYLSSDKPENNFLADAVTSARQLLWQHDLDDASLSQVVNALVCQPPVGIEIVIIVNLLELANDYFNSTTPTHFVELPIDQFLLALDGVFTDEEAIPAARVIECPANRDKVLYLFQDFDWVSDSTQPHLMRELLALLNQLANVIVLTQYANLSTSISVYSDEPPVRVFENFSHVRYSSYSSSAYPNFFRIEPHPDDRMSASKINQVVQIG